MSSLAACHISPIVIQSTTKIMDDSGDDSSDVAVVGDSIGNKLEFNPVRDALARYLHLMLEVQCKDLFSTTAGELGTPCKIVRVTADGNCFFRAVSEAVSGADEYHETLRRLVVKQLQSNDAAYVNILRRGYTSVSEYISSSAMSSLGTWATEVEIQAAADCLGVSIYTYLNNRWLKYSCRSVPLSNQGIYLRNCGCHYDAVVCVKRPGTQSSSSSSSSCYGFCKGDVSENSGAAASHMHAYNTPPSSKGACPSLGHPIGGDDRQYGHNGHQGSSPDDGTWDDGDGDEDRAPDMHCGYYTRETVGEFEDGDHHGQFGDYRADRGEVEYGDDVELEDEEEEEEEKDEEEDEEEEKEEEEDEEEDDENDDLECEAYGQDWEDSIDRETDEYGGLLTDLEEIEEEEIDLRRDVMEQQCYLPWSPLRLWHSFLEWLGGRWWGLVSEDDIRSFMNSPKRRIGDVVITAHIGNTPGGVCSVTAKTEESMYETFDMVIQRGNYTCTALVLGVFENPIDMMKQLNRDMGHTLHMCGRPKTVVPRFEMFPVTHVAKEMCFLVRFLNRSWWGVLHHSSLESSPEHLRAVVEHLERQTPRCYNPCATIHCTDNDSVGYLFEFVTLMGRRLHVTFDSAGFMVGTSARFHMLTDVLGYITKTDKVTLVSRPQPAAAAAAAAAAHLSI